MPPAPPPVWTDAVLHERALATLAGHVALAGPSVPAAVAARPAFDFSAAHAAIVGPRRTFDHAAFASAPHLRVIARTGIGCDNVDVDAATAAGVCVVNTPDAPTESTAEFAVALMLAVARRVAAADRQAKAGVWSLDPGVMGIDLAGRTLGLVGFGRIARRVAEMARAFRMTVAAYDPFVNSATMAAAGVVSCPHLPDLVRIASVLSLHAPLLPDTRGLIGAEQLALLPRGAIVVNAARGPLIDEAALLAALESGHVFGAGLDVWHVEPTPPEHPLFRHPRVVATPHMAAFTEEGRERSHVSAAHLVLATLRGERPTTLVNPDVWPARRR